MKDTTTYIEHTIKKEVEITKLITIHYFEYTKDFKYHGESHNFWEIMYIDRGNAYVLCDGNDYLLTQGDMIFLPPDLFHSIRADDLHPSNVFIISFVANSELLPLLGEQVFKISNKMRGLIHSIIQEGELAFELPMPNRYCLQEKVNSLPGSQQLVKMRLEELIIQLFRKKVTHCGASQLQSSVTRSRFDNNIAAAIMDLLRKHTYGNLTIEEITQQLGYGKTYISTVFKKVYGVSIMTCYTELKIKEAKYLIRDHRMSIAEISEKLGFNSPQYFSKRFRQFVHMSPKQYESSIKENWNSLIEE